MPQAASGAATPAEIQLAADRGLYAPAHEHDACGVGFVAHIKGTKDHAIIEQGLKILENLDHRGAVGADKLMGDGAGILIQIPDDYFRAEMAQQGVELPPFGEYGVGMIFLPKEHASRLACVPGRPCTSASRPTPSPSGRSRTRTGWWRTTARSTPSRATSTGCAPAKA